jgi:PPP family 3-phenylpropionic acid transporter
MEVRALLLACFLMALAHGAYYSFYSIYVAEQGVSQSMIGWLWSIGVLAEILVFALMPQLTQRFALRTLFLFGLSVAVVRFGLIGFGAKSLAMLVVAQIGHAFTFGSHHAVSMNYIHRYFVGRHQAKGQALYIAVSFGLGGSLGGILAGMAWNQLGGSVIFVLSAAVALAGLMVACLALKE